MKGLPNPQENDKTAESARTSADHRSREDFDNAAILGPHPGMKKQTAPFPVCACKPKSGK